MDKTQKTNNKLNIIKNIFIVAVSILAISAIVYSGLQHNRIAALDRQINSLNDTTKIGEAKNSKLSSEISNMKKAIITLQGQIKSTDEGTQVDESPSVSLGSKITVSNVGHQAITVPASDSHGPVSTDYFAISIVLTNQSTINQTYDSSNFSAITDSGVAIKSPSFGPGIEQAVWSRSELTPGGHMEIVLLFPSDRNLIALTLTIPGSSDQLIVALPSAS